MEKIIIKYLNNEASTAELEKLEIWLEIKANQKKFKSFISTQYLIDRTFVPKTTAPKVLSIEKEQSENHSQKSWWSGHSFLKYAAVFAALILGGFYFFYNTGTPQDFNRSNQITLELEDGTLKVMDENESVISLEQSTIHQDRHKLVYKKQDGNLNTELEYNVLKVPFGKTFELNLADGSEIILNAGTQLKYPVVFSEEGERKVFLKGEAFFEVAHDASRPFIVSTKEMDVEVLGTQFNVMAYPKDEKTNALLVSGKVRATQKQKNGINADSVVLVPKQLAEIDEDKIRVSTVDTQKYLAWIDGKIIFINDSFDLIQNKLERKYDVKIENNFQELNEIKITASFNTESIDQVLETFQKYKAFKYKKRGDTIIISKP